MNQDKSLPIIEVAYRLALQLNKIVVKFTRHQRPGLGRRIEEAGFNFLEEKLGVFLNPRKTLLKPTTDGLDFLGYRIFYYHLLLRKKNMKKVKKRFLNLARRYAKGDLKLLDIKSSLAGWLGYAGFANTYNFRRKLFADFRLKREPSRKL